MSDPHARAAQAYLARAKTGLDQRQLEANALITAANRLEEVCRQWQSPRLAIMLDEALTYNRKLWTIFAAEAADGADRLPPELRNNIASLALFVFRRTLHLLAQPEPEKIEVLVEINRSIAAGLMTRSDHPDPATPTTGSAEPVFESC